MSTHICECSGTTISYNNYGRWGTGTCETCKSYCFPDHLIQTEKQIQNQVGVSESQMIDVKSAFAIGSQLMQFPRNYNRYINNYPHRNLSDRTNASNSAINFYNNVPTRGSSTRSSITSNKPGSMVPGGKGVDVKHDSYARYLGKLKASNIYFNENKQHPNYIPPTGSRLRPAVNNKSYGFSIISVKKCVCKN